MALARIISYMLYNNNLYNLILIYFYNIIHRATLRVVVVVVERRRGRKSGRSRRSTVALGST